MKDCDGSGRIPDGSSYQNPGVIVYLPCKGCKRCEASKASSCEYCGGRMIKADDWIDYDWKGAPFARFKMIQCLSCHEYKGGKIECEKSKCL